MVALLYKSRIRSVLELMMSPTVKMSMMAIVGAIIGSVMCSACCQRFAPSSRADS